MKTEFILLLISDPIGRLLTNHRFHRGGKIKNKKLTGFFHLLGLAFFSWLENSTTIIWPTKKRWSNPFACYNVSALFYPPRQFPSNCSGFLSMFGLMTGQFFGILPVCRFHIFRKNILNFFFSITIMIFNGFDCDRPVFCKPDI